MHIRPHTPLQTELWMLHDSNYLGRQDLPSSLCTLASGNSCTVNSNKQINISGHIIKTVITHYLFIDSSYLIIFSPETPKEREKQKDQCRTYLHIICFLLATSQVVQPTLSPTHLDILVSDGILEASSAPRQKSHQSNNNISTAGAGRFAYDSRVLSRRVDFYRIHTSLCHHLILVCHGNAG